MLWKSKKQMFKINFGTSHVIRCKTNHFNLLFLLYGVQRSYTPFKSCLQFEQNELVEE